MDCHSQGITTKLSVFGQARMMDKPSLLGIHYFHAFSSMALMKRNSGNMHIVQVQNFGVNDFKITCALSFYDPNQIANSL